MKQVDVIPKDSEGTASGALVLVTVLFVCLKRGFGLVGFCTARDPKGGGPGTGRDAGGSTGDRAPSGGGCGPGA